MLQSELSIIPFRQVAETKACRIRDASLLPVVDVVEFAVSGQHRQYAVRSRCATHARPGASGQPQCEPDSDC